MAKALGTDIIEFYTNGWPDGYYIDDFEIDPDPESKQINPDETYDLDKFGVLIDESTSEAKDFSYFFNKWKRAQTFTTLVVRIPKELETVVSDYLKASGCKIE